MLWKILSLFVISSYVLSLKNLRLKEIEKLIEKFDSTLDVNYLFYDKVRAQRNNPNLCSAEYGPHCSLINNQSITQMGPKKPVETLEERIAKAGLIQELDRTRAKQRDNPNTFLVVNNKHRDQTLGQTQAASEKENEILLTFERVNLVEEEAKVTQSLKFTESKGFATDKDQTQEAIFQITFDNLYGPSKNQVFNRKSTIDSSKNNKKDIPLSEMEPENTYLFTKKDEKGYIRFTRPIEVKHFYVRKHNFIYYQEERKSQGGNTNKIEFNLVGQLGGKDVIEYKKDTFTNYNKFVKVLPKEEDKSVLIDTLVVSANTDIDNVWINMGKPFGGKSTTGDQKAAITIKDWEEIFEYIMEKAEEFKNLKDPKAKTKIINDALEAFLKKRGFAEEQIRRVVKGVEIEWKGDSVYEVHMDPDLFSDQDMKGFMKDPEIQKLTEQVLNDPEIRKLVEQAQHDPTFKTQFKMLSQEQVDKILKNANNPKNPKDNEEAEKKKKASTGI